jgi:NAD+ kinase
LQPETPRPRKIRKVLVVINKHKDLTRTVADEFRDFFSSRKIALEIHAFRERPPLAKPRLAGVDLAVSLGGDGTLLYCSQLLAGGDIPILAVNLGNFGFITDVTYTEWKETYDKYSQGLIGVSGRIMLDAEVKRRGRRAARFLGLNDGGILSSGISKIVRYRADGIVVATPTGSTAYSLSAGGPILHPEMEAFILSPICPFSLSHRPLVVPGSEYVEIRIERGQRTNVILTLDGQNEYRLEEDDIVYFRQSQHVTRIIRSGKRNFYEVLRSKLSWSGEPHA